MRELPAAVLRLIDLALEEDLGPGDVTAAALIGPLKGRAIIEAREKTVVCGLGVAESVFKRIDPDIRFKGLAGEGETAAEGDVLAELTGSVASLLAGERTALNFIQRMSGVASLSRQYAERAKNKAVVLDSRKTIPGWRWLDKLAVRTGGCRNHRMGLFDGILIKDNHIAACGGIRQAVARALVNLPPGLTVEVEVDSIAGIKEALSAGAGIIMLDNFTSDQVAAAIPIVAGRALVEVSGGITLENIDGYIQSGKVDFISVGALTHSAVSKDISMEIME